MREKIRITEEQYVNHWKYRNHEILEETAQESFLSLIESQQQKKKNWLRQLYTIKNKRTTIIIPCKLE